MTDIIDEDGGPKGEAPNASEAVYEVGYKKPPRHTRFKPGQSGNPKGRAKGSRGLKTDLHAELNRPVEVQLGEYRFKGTTQQLALRTLALLAANGNLKAISQLLPLILTVFGTEDRGAAKSGLSPHDQAVLDNFMAAFGGNDAALGEDVDDCGGQPLADAGGSGARIIDPPAADQANGDPEENRP